MGLKKTQAKSRRLKWINSPQTFAQKKGLLQSPSINVEITNLADGILGFQSMAWHSKRMAFFDLKKHSRYPVDQLCCCQSKEHVVV